MRTISFRLRIALFSSLISGLVLAGFGAAWWVVLHRQKVETVDTEIRSLGARHPGWFANRGGYERLNSALEFIFGDEPQDHLILCVKDSAGRTLYTSSGWPKDLAPEHIDSALVDRPSANSSAVSAGDAHSPGAGRSAGSGPGPGPWRWGRGQGLGGGGGPPQVAFTKVPKFQTVHVGQDAWRVGALGTADTTLIIGLNFAATQAELDRIRNLFLITLPIALLLIGAGGWLVSGRALRPLRAIAQTAERVTAKGLDQRIPLSSEDPEIARLIGMLNRMMDRLETSFQQASRFSADASHELKTPLAVMQGELEQALQTSEPGSPHQQLLASLLEETQRLKTITRHLLLLAQADAGQMPLTRERLDLGALAGGMREDLQTIADESHLRLDAQLTPEVWVEVDPTLLRQTLQNLFQNAVRYNEPNGWISVRLSRLDQEAELEVGNGGPGIPVADRQKIFDRFFRSDAARGRRIDGVGLGLSLAREIARAHGGELELTSSEPGRTMFRLRLPLASAGDAHRT